MSKALEEAQKVVALATDDDKRVFSLLEALPSSAHPVEYSLRLSRSFHVSNFDAG